MNSPLIGTGLLKRCPRCGRLGEVAINTQYKKFEINWPPRETSSRGRADPARRDIALDLGDLLAEDMGCGYDDPTGVPRCALALETEKREAAERERDEARDRASELNVVLVAAEVIGFSVDRRENGSISVRNLRAEAAEKALAEAREALMVCDPDVALAALAAIDKVLGQSPIKPR